MASISSENADLVAAAIADQKADVLRGKLTAEIRRLVAEDHGKPLSEEFFRNWLGESGLVTKEEAADFDIDTDGPMPFTVG